MLNYNLLSATLICWLQLQAQILLVNSSGRRLLGVGFIPSEYNEKLNKFVCPGVGYYPVPHNCTQFFHCFFPGHQPASIYACKGYNMKFHHLSRKCEPNKYVDCNLCRNKAGTIFQDLTSKYHFIRCAHGAIAERFKCKVGEFNSIAMTCINKAGDIIHDSMLDPAEDMIQFMKQWHHRLKVQTLELKIKSMKEEQKSKPKKFKIPNNGNGKCKR